jgi:hypothetical protein
MKSSEDVTLLESPPLHEWSAYRGLKGPSPGEDPKPSLIGPLTHWKGLAYDVRRSDDSMPSPMCAQLMHVSDSILSG